MKLKFISLPFVFISFCSLLNSVTWDIKLDGSGDFTTIQEGIDASTDSDTVLVYPGTYFENLDFNGKNISLASLELTTGNEQYIGSTIMDGQQLESCIRIHNGETDARIQGFTIQNGYGTQFWSRDGGGVLVHDYSTAYITNCIIKNNKATLGAGLYARHGFLHVSGLDIFENNAGWGGAIYMADESTIDFDIENLCNIYNNNAGKGADFYIDDTGQVDIIVDTFSVSTPSHYFAESIEGSSYTFSIQNNWMELEPNDLYVAVDGNDSNSGLTPDDPLKNISWAVRKIQADEQNPRTVHVASGVYSWEANQQIFPLGCKEYVSIIGEDMDNTILFNDYAIFALIADHLNGFTEVSNFSISNSSEYYTGSVIIAQEVNVFKLSNLKIQNNSNISRIIITEHIYNIFKNLIISDNTAYHGVLSFEENSGIMKNCIISNNSLYSSTHNYKVVQIDAHDEEEFIVENCVFANNTTYNECRFINLMSGWGEEPTIRFNNCLFSDNNTVNDACVVNYNQGITEFNNCTFTNNSSYLSTIKSYGDLTLKNTIIHDSTSFNYDVFMANYEPISGETYELNVDYCNMKNGENGIHNQNGVNTINWGVGNISEDPLFFSLSSNYPYQLSEFSPCIDTGTPDASGLSLPPWDLLHNERVWDGDYNGVAIIDMGCYEYGADPVSVFDDPIQLTDYQLINYPNPFNPSTTIVFNLPVSGKVKLEVFNIKGQKVKTLLNEEMQKGEHSIVWSCLDSNNKPVSSGIYLYKIKAGKQESVNRMLLLK